MPLREHKSEFKGEEKAPHAVRNDSEPPIKPGQALLAVTFFSDPDLGESQSRFCQACVRSARHSLVITGMAATTNCVTAMSHNPKKMPCFTMFYKVDGTSPLLYARVIQ